MTAEEWAEQIALCKNSAVKEMEKTLEKYNTSTGLFFLKLRYHS